MNANDAYAALRAECQQIGLIRATASLLNWDEQTQLPKAGTAFRAEQLAFLGKMAHERFTAPQVGEWIATIEGSDLVADPESDAAANVRELRRSYDRATKLPATLVEAMAKHDVLAQQWDPLESTCRHASLSIL